MAEKNAPVYTGLMRLTEGTKGLVEKYGKRKGMKLYEAGEEVTLLGLSFADATADDLPADVRKIVAAFAERKGLTFNAGLEKLITVGLSRQNALDNYGQAKKAAARPARKARGRTKTARRTNAEKAVRRTRKKATR